MDVNRKLDFDEQQQTIDSPAFQRREAALQTRTALLRSSQSASTTSSMMTSLSFGSSIGSSIAAASQALAGDPLQSLCRFLMSEFLETLALMSASETCSIIKTVQQIWKAP